MSKPPLQPHYIKSARQLDKLWAKFAFQSGSYLQINGIKNNQLLMDLCATSKKPAFAQRLRLALAFLMGKYKGDTHRLFHDQVKSLESETISSNDYGLWVENYDSKAPAYLAKLMDQARGFHHQPLITVVMPTYNSNLDFLKLAIESVQAQTYQHWELCICDDASSQPSVATLVASYANIDDRIKFIQNPINQGISKTANQASQLGKGEWIGFLDHDDELSQDALHWVVDSINRSPNTKFIYTDEDKLNDLGERYDPYFKPEFNYELMLAQNMVCHFTCINRSLFEELGGLRSEYDGSQDYDLTLRVIEVIPPSEIVHIPRVLYHWRACEGSTAITTDNKGYALAAARQAIADHLERTGLAGTVTDTIVPFYNRVVFDLPSPAPSVSIIIPTRDKLELIKVCVESILEKTQYTHFNICIVDNGSQDPRVIDFYQSLPKDRVQIINADIPFNFSKLVNLGVQASSSEVVVLLNNDIEVLDAGWLSELVSHTVRPGVGAVGAKLLYPNGRSQHNGVILGLGTLPNRSHGVAGHSHKWFPDEQPGYISRAQLHQAFSAVTGACLAVKRTTWGALGGFDENLVVAFNDVDFCLRVQKSGLRNVWTPHAKLVHHESASRGYEDTPEKQARYLVEAAYMVKNWEAELMNDHFYSPNLTLKLEDFSLAWPPRVS